MCLTIDKKFKSKKEALDYFEKPLIAKKDIKVYKILDTEGSNYFSPHLQFEFKKGFQYTESEFTYYITIDGSLQINQGLHAYTTKKPIIQYCLTRRIVAEMWVPKGSKYFLGIGDEIVADNLIWY